MLIHNLEDESTDTSPPINFDNLCSVCYDEMGSDNRPIVELACGHKFHSECILKVFKNLKGKRQCPYCRSDGGYLPLPPGMAPIKFIHAEYYQSNYQIQFIPGRCQYILKRGKNAGQQCSFQMKCEGGLCTKHHKYFLKKIKDENEVSELENSLGAT